MKYYMPTKVYEQAGCVRAHGAEICALGSRAMIVTGRGSAKRNGALADVEAALMEGGVSWTVFDEVEENPSVETVMKAAGIARAEGTDLFIGIGGGSPMDAAKAISLMTYEKDRGPAYLFESPADVKNYPIVLIPTTCGTGSEVTAVSVLTRHEKKTKKGINAKIFAELALLDGTYLSYAPRNVLCNTSVDALGHMIESYIHIDANDYSRTFVLQGLRIWRRCIPALKGEKKAEAQDYRNLINASMMGGIAIAQSGTTLPHALSYRLTYDLGMPHGQAVGYYLPGYLAEASPEDQAFILEGIGCASVEAFRALIGELIGPFDLSDEILEAAVQMVASNPAKMELCPFPTDIALLRRMSQWQ